MINKLILFERSIYGSAMSNANYNPHNLILRLDDKLDTNAGVVDLAVDFNSSLVHEWTHWFQHNCTSFGVFLSSLRFSQSTTLMTWLREFPSEFIQKLLLDRKDKNYPIININPNNQFPIYRDSGNYKNELNLFSQIWYDHQLVYTIFENDVLAESVGLPPNKVIGEVIGDVLLYLDSSMKMIDYPGNDIAREIFCPQEEKLTFIKNGRDRLNSLSLMECAASCSELLVIGSGIGMFLNDQNSKYNKTLKQIMTSSYGIPIKMYLSKLGINIDELSDHLSTISVICFIALNPPLPPFNVKAPEDKKSWSWFDIYPPLRFVQVLDAIPFIGCLKKNNPSHNEINEYINSIIAFLDLPTIVEDSFPKLSNVKDFDNYDSEMSFDSFDYLFWAQKKLAHFRKDKFPLISNLGSCFHGDLVSDYLDDIIDFGSQNIPFNKSPLSWSSNDNIELHGNVDFANKLLVSVTSNYCLTDLMVGKGDYDLRQFPPELARDPNFNKIVRETIYRSLVEIKNE